MLKLPDKYGFESLSLGGKIEKLLSASKFAKGTGDSVIFYCNSMALSK